jgi:hypothetical protein
MAIQSRNVRCVRLDVILACNNEASPAFAEVIAWICCWLAFYGIGLSAPGASPSAWTGSDNARKHPDKMVLISEVAYRSDFLERRVGPQKQVLRRSDTAF